MKTGNQKGHTDSKWENLGLILSASNPVMPTICDDWAHEMWLSRMEVLYKQPSEMLDGAGSVSDHRNKANIAIKQIVQ